MSERGPMDCGPEPCPTDVREDGSMPTPAEMGVRVVGDGDDTATAAPLAEPR